MRREDMGDKKNGKQLYQIDKEEPYIKKKKKKKVEIILYFLILIM